ncbi:hypothetical protein ISCGN_022607 [Ixodes scapularis]
MNEIELTSKSSLNPLNQFQCLAKESKNNKPPLSLQARLVATRRATETALALGTASGGEVDFRSCSTNEHPPLQGAPCHLVPALDLGVQSHTGASWKATWLQ